MVQNIGITKDATSGDHESFEKYTEFVPEEMDEIIHPSEIAHNIEADARQFESIIKLTDPRCINNYRTSPIQTIKKLFPQWFKIQVKSIITRITQ